MRGLPSSWDPTAFVSYKKIDPYDAIWSPCNRFIAIVDQRSVVILDAATLGRLDIFAITSGYLDNEYWRPSFSPDGHCLTLIGIGELISWDLQTGGSFRRGTIPSGLEREARPIAFSSTYSEDGKVVAAAYSAWNFDDIKHDSFNRFDTFIHTCHLSGKEAGPRCTPKGRIVEPIWTHEKCIRFVTIDRGSVTVSEVEFTLKNPPVEVESLPIADKIVDGERFLFLPSLSRLAFTVGDTIQVWDAQAAKLLLESELPSFTYTTILPIGSFSPDGRFFAHLDVNGVARVWKESPAGYILHQNLQFVIPNIYQKIEPRLSPSGESIFMSPDRREFHLWHTRDQDLSLPSVSAGDVDKNSFTLVFSPDEIFGAFARRGENVVTIFNTLTGDSQLAINTDTGIMRLEMTGSALTVVGEEKIVTWDLPGGDCTFNASISDSVRTTSLHRNQDTPTYGSISPDLGHIAFLSGLYSQTHLHIYDKSTRRYLTSNLPFYARRVEFTRDGREVWTASDDFSHKEGWEIVEDSGSGSTQLEPQDRFVSPSGVFAWESRRAYDVTGDGWVLSAAQKRLLWLPHRWRSQVWRAAESGRFLGLLHQELSEVVILEFPE